jgi:hypothetical protein
MKHNKGIEHFLNGDIYNGEYINGKPDGNGIYLWDNGNEYRGLYIYILYYINIILYFIILYYIILYYIILLIG